MSAASSVKATSPQRHHSESNINNTCRPTRQCPKPELKSSIPKPISYKQSRESVRVLCGAKTSQWTFRSSDRGKTSCSLKSRVSSTIPIPSFKQHKSTRFHTSYEQTTTPTLSPRPLSTPHQNSSSPVKAKVNSRPYASTKPKSQSTPTNIRKTNSNTSTVADSTPVDPSEKSTIKTCSAGEKVFSNDELLEKQRQILTIYNELKKVQSSRELRPLENELCLLMQKKTLRLEDICVETALLSNEGAQEFLNKFEKQMQEFLESWLRLMCDVVLTTRRTPVHHLSIPDPTLDINTEMDKFLNNLGEFLPAKLEKIRDEHVKVMTVVMHGVISLSKEYTDLKDEHFRLEKTQDQIHYELKQKVLILGDENMKLEKKYESAVEKYNEEKAKTEQLERQKLSVHKDVLEVKKIMKCLEGKCKEWEGRVKKIDSKCKSMEVVIRNKEVASEKDAKQHRELFNKYNEAKYTIDNLKSALEESDQARMSLKSTNTKMEDELRAVKDSLEELLQIRNQLVEELSNKNKKLIDTEKELDVLTQDTQNITSNVLVVDLTKNVHQQNLQIQELKKQITNMENILKEKTTREDMLMMQVSELQKQPLKNEVTMRTQIKDLHYALKAMTEEKAVLEKIIAQKTLELDQRDLLLKEHGQILQVRDELIPIVQNRQHKQQECIERLRGVIFEHQMTYYNQGSEGNFKNKGQTIFKPVELLENYNIFDPAKVEKEMSFQREKMTDLFNLLERKQMDMTRLERRLRDLQGIQNEREQVVMEKEARITSLLKELTEQRASKSRGLFSLFSTQD